ncbi:DUF445 domain-containing protein [Saxibacter everestensis]|uniref:DUF445 domain-containing protein n=1 Tax=Saxibacter everestensis TaxID=2909229 RepID=A0ABY8QTY4_9MICO|nr:DUF445 domain-containing protein [Brevibacteriaceae bacterium ZFBP1038]
MSLSLNASTAMGEADLIRLRALRKMRVIAVSLLILAAIIFVLTQTLTDRTGVWGFVNRGAEAAMIGALADWFAVTALFRHPLGLPIPHTAIIPKRKEVLGQSLTEFVATNFLDGAVVKDKVLRAEPARRLGEWLKPVENRQKVVVRAAGIASVGISKVKDADVESLVEQVMLPKLAEAEKSPLLGHFLAGVVEDGSHHGLVDLVATESYAWLTRNPDVVERVVAGRAPSWVPQWVNAQVTNRIRQELLGWVSDVRDRPDHPARKSLDELLAKLADDMQHDAGTMARTEAVINRALTRPGLADTVTALWRSIQRALIEALDDEEGVLRRRGIEALGDLAERLTAEPEFQQRIDSQLASAAETIATSFGPELATVISDTVERWDGNEAAEKIELHVGRDLQFIRINGTVVGALVGLGIHALTLVLG